MTDLFRQNYVPLTDENKKQIGAIKIYAEDLANLITRHQTEPNTSALATAVYHLQTAVMWATYHFSDPERQE